MAKLAGTPTVDKAEWCEEQIHNTLLQIDAVDAAILWCVSNNKSKYTINTGQTNQSVENKTTAELYEMKENLLTYLDSIEACCGITPVAMQVRPPC